MDILYFKFLLFSSASCKLRGTLCSSIWNKSKWSSNSMWKGQEFKRADVDLEQFFLSQMGDARPLDSLKSFLCSLIKWILRGMGSFTWQIQHLCPCPVPQVQYWLGKILYIYSRVLFVTLSICVLHGNILMWSIPFFSGRNTKSRTVLQCHTCAFLCHNKETTLHSWLLGNTPEMSLCCGSGNSQRLWEITLRNHKSYTL